MLGTDPRRSSTCFSRKTCICAGLPSYPVSFSQSETPPASLPRAKSCTRVTLGKKLREHGRLVPPEAGCSRYSAASVMCSSRAVAVGAKLDRLRAGLLERGSAEVVGQAQDAERRTQRLVGVGTAMHLLAQHRGGRRTGRLGPLEQRSWLSSITARCRSGRCAGSVTKRRGPSCRRCVATAWPR